MNGSRRRDTVLPPGRAVTGSASSKSAPPLLAYLIQYHFFQRPRLSYLNLRWRLTSSPAAPRLLLPWFEADHPRLVTCPFFSYPMLVFYWQRLNAIKGLELTLTAKLAPNQGCVRTIRAVCGIVLV